MKKKNLKKIKPVPVLLKIPSKPQPIQHQTLEQAKRILDKVDSFSASPEGIKAGASKNSNNNYKKQKNVKKETIEQNEHQKEMDRIANDMAVLFERKITTSELAKWLTIANSHSDPNGDLLWGLGYNVLPQLIESKTKEDRINLLKDELPGTFSVYRIANKSLFQLGEDYFRKNKGLGYFVEQIEEFMSVYLVLLSICEKFEHYEYEERAMEKELDKAA